MSETAILEGIRVLDVGSFIFGPAAGTVMGDFGADVIKVEPPDIGDPYRYLTTIPPLPSCDVNYCWILDGRNKKSLALDLKDAEAHELLLELVRQADVFLTNYPPRVLESLSLRYEDLQPLNERLVFAHATGYGENGPELGKPGYDFTAWWGRSGLADVVRAPGSNPASSSPGMGDHPSAMSLFGAIMLALYRRERSGRGSKVGSSLLANGVWSNSILLQSQLCGAGPFEPPPLEKPTNALINMYRTRDDRWLQLVLVQEDKLWPRFCKALDEPELIDDPRFSELKSRRAHALDLAEILRPLFASRDLVEWRKRLDAVGVTSAHVATLEELAEDPQAEASGLFPAIEDGNGRAMRTVTNPIEVEGLAKRPPGPAPDIGEHTDEVLRSIGVDDARLAALRERGAIR